MPPKPKLPGSTPDNTPDNPPDEPPLTVSELRENVIVALRAYLDKLRSASPSEARVELIREARIALHQFQANNTS